MTVLFVFGVLTACGRGQTGWQQFPVPVYVDSSIMGSDTSRQDFEDGMKFWEERAGKKLFEVMGEWTGSALPYQGDAKNPDAIVENVVFVHHAWPFEPGYVGMTVVKPFDSGQQAMVMINPSTSFCHGDCEFNFSQTSLRKTFAHELGHFIGLAHVNDRNNIMNPQSTPGGVLSSQQIDRAALQAVLQSASR